MPVPIPTPPAIPFIGNALDINPESSLQSFQRLSNLYGPIYRLSLLGRNVVVIGSQALMNEVADESRFVKVVEGTPLEELRNGIGDGLFTAYGPEEKNWGIAHRVLMPAFGPLSIRNMFDEMHDIAKQLLMKWARHGPEHIIPVTDDFTRLTLDTLGLCAMNYRFNSFYKENMHPFPTAMTEFLLESGLRSFRPRIAQLFFRDSAKKHDANISLMKNISDELVKARRAHPSDRKDLLSTMLNGTDPKTGERLDDESITFNLITFLIAGYETTSGMLSYAFYYLLKNPTAYHNAQSEVDEIYGRGPITVGKLTKLSYIDAVLRETLRLQPPAPFITLKAKKDEIIDGKYHIPKGEPIFAMLSKIQTDPLVFGENAEEWEPERMLNEKFDELNKRFPNCWKPFGNGMRGCIGRPFAWQEALLVIAILLQYFNFTLVDHSYNLATKQTLTIKPDGFHMRATLRNNLTPTELQDYLTYGKVEVPQATRVGGADLDGAVIQTNSKGKKLAIFYGSNSGTCEALARRLASGAASYGIYADVNALDTAKENIPNAPIVVITASYDGRPADNAHHFVTWLESLKANEMENVSYTVFGCGHRDWTQTFYKIPRLIDNLLEERGGRRVAALGTADCAAGDVFNDFETWEEKVFWPAMKVQVGGLEDTPEVPIETTLNVEVSAPRSSTLKQDMKTAEVVATKALSAPGVPERRHMEIRLPSDMTYSAGDYLAILPLNPKSSVQRAMCYFGFTWDTMLKITSQGYTMLPTDVPIAVAEVLGSYVELAQPASRRDIMRLSEFTTDAKIKESLIYLSGQCFAKEITAKRVSVLDLLESHPSITLPFSFFLQMLPPMRVRQYSISSSPLWNPAHVTLTYTVLDHPALSGYGRHRGIASSYLSSLGVGDTLYVSVKKSHAFHLPADVEHVPVILVAAGTGLAPLRGFVQERAAQISVGRILAPAILFFGCRSPNVDNLYSEEFDHWEQIGAIDIRRAYSRDPMQSNGCKYVQDRLWADRKDIVELWERGGKFLVCGSHQVGEGVKEVSIKIMMDDAENKGMDITEKKAAAWFESIRNDRFVTDIFS